MLTSGSPGQNEISLTPTGKRGSGIISEIKMTFGNFDNRFSFSKLSQVSSIKKVTKKYLEWYKNKQILQERELFKQSVCFCSF